VTPTNYILKIRICITSCVLLIATYEGVAQNYKYEYEHFTEENGLPSKRVYDIAFDDDGLMWLCTQNGIATYDGNRFERVTQLDANIAYKSLEFDTNRKLWIVTAKNELNLSLSEKILIHDPSSGTTSNILESITSAKDILQAKDNFNIWSDNIQTIFLLSQETKELFYYTGDSLRTTNIKSHTPIYSQDLKQEYSVTTNTHDTLSKINVKTNETLEYDINAVVMPIFQDDELALKYVKDLDDVYLENYTYSILLTLEHDTLFSDEKHILEYARINNDIYITNAKNLISYNTESKVSIDINKALGGIFNNNDIIDIQTNNDELWVLSDAGLFKIIKTTPLFNTAISGYGQSARNIIDLGNNEILIGTEIGLVKVDLTTGKETNYNKKYHCYTISQLDSTRFLISTHSQFPAIWDMENPDVFETQHLTDISKKTNKKTEAMIFNHIDIIGNIWLTNPKGIYKYDIDNSTIEIIDQKAENIPYYSDMTTNTERVGKVFLLKDKGLDELDINTEKIRTFDALAGTKVSAIYADKIESNIYWICTKYKGIYKWKYDGDVVKKYTIADGLRSNNVHSAQQDKKGNIWMSTDFGISILDKESDKITTLTTVNGLHENEFNSHSHLTIGDSIFVFGGIDGITYFKPNEADNSIYNSPTKIIGIQYTDRKTGLENLKDIDESVTTIKLNTNQLNAKLVLGNTIKGTPSTIRYFFTNQNSSWKYSQNNTIDLNNIVKGENTLLISRQQGINKWSNPLTITIMKPIPLYENKWFYILGSALLLTLIIYYLNNRNKKAESLNKEIQKQVDEKTLELSKNNTTLRKANELNDDLFEIIGHDLRSPITSLTNVTKSFEYLNEKGSPEEMIKLGKSVDQNAKKLLNTIDKLIRWSQLKRNSQIELENVGIRNLIKDVIATHDSLISHKEIIIDISEVSSKTKIYTDYGSIRSIIKNILSNAINFSDINSTIYISAIQNQSNTIIKIADQGDGISKDKIVQILDRKISVSFQGLSNEKGLGIGLKNSIKLLDNLRGKIAFNQNSPKGTIVEISLENSLPQDLI